MTTSPSTNSGGLIWQYPGYEKVFPQALVIKLEQNYRSTQNILNAANQVIQNNVGRKSKTLWTENEDGEKIHFRQFMNAYEEAEYICGEISKRYGPMRQSIKTLPFFTEPMPSPVFSRKNF